jgi:hypothetical protein
MPAVAPSCAKKKEMEMSVMDTTYYDTMQVLFVIAMMMVALGVSTYLSRQLP